MKGFAQFLSVLFHPIFLGMYCFLYLIFSPAIAIFSPEIYGNWSLFATVSAISIGFPLIFCLILKKMQVISSLQMDNRNERWAIYIYVWWLYLCFSVAFYLFDFAFLFSAIALAASAAILVLFVVNFFWKISAHACGMGGLCGLIFSTSLVWHQFPITLMAIAIFAAGMVGSSRLFLKKHTLAQLCAGFAVGFCCTFFGVIVL